MAPALTTTPLAELRSRWDAPFLADPSACAAMAARTTLTRELAAAILAAPLYDAEAGARTRVGSMIIAGGGWSKERGDAADAAAEPGTPEWRAALGDHEHATLTADGHGANRGTWCACPNDEVFADQWIRYEHWTAEGMSRHGYVHSECRRLLQAG